MNKKKKFIPFPRIFSPKQASKGKSHIGSCMDKI